MELGVPRRRGLEEVGGEPAGGGTDHADADGPRHLVAERGQVAEHRLELDAHAPGAGGDGLALLGELAGGTVDQHGADLALQPGDVGRHVGLAVGEAGLTGGRRLPGEALLFGIYSLMGETLPSMALTRGMVLMARGWPAATVRQAGKAAAERLEPLVSPYARPLLADHRSAGHA